MAIQTPSTTYASLRCGKKVEVYIIRRISTSHGDVHTYLFAPLL